MSNFVIRSMLGLAAFVAIACIILFLFRISFYIVGFIFEMVVGIIAGLIVFLVILIAINR